MSWSSLDAGDTRSSCRTACPSARSNKRRERELRIAVAMCSCAIVTWFSCQSRPISFRACLHHVRLELSHRGASLEAALDDDPHRLAPVAGELGAEVALAQIVEVAGHGASRCRAAAVRSIAGPAAQAARAARASRSGARTSRTRRPITSSSVGGRADRAQDDIAVGAPARAGLGAVAPSRNAVAWPRSGASAGGSLARMYRPPSVEPSSTLLPRRSRAQRTFELRQAVAIGPRGPRIAEPREITLDQLALLPRRGVVPHRGERGVRGQPLLDRRVVAVHRHR